MPLANVMYRVNGVNCHLRVDDDSITWTPVQQAAQQQQQLQHSYQSQQQAGDGSSGKRQQYNFKSTTKCISFDQIVGFSKTRKRIKILYCKKFSHGALLKSKKLSIKQCSKSSSSIASSLSSLPSSLELSKVIRNEQETTTTTITTEASNSRQKSSYSDNSSKRHGDKKRGSVQNKSTTLDSSDSSDLTAAAASHKLPSPLASLSRQLTNSLELKRRDRPKKLIIFVNPYGGKGQALHLYKSVVRRLLDVAQVEHEVIITKHANHARDTIEDPQFNVELYDGIVCIGGDGMFSELMNGLLFRYNRHLIVANKLSDADLDQLSASLASGVSGGDNDEQDQHQHQHLQAPLVGHNGQQQIGNCNKAKPAESSNRGDISNIKQATNADCEQAATGVGATDGDSGPDSLVQSADIVGQLAACKRLDTINHPNGDGATNVNIGRTDTNETLPGYTQQQQQQQRNLLLKFRQLLGGIGQPFRSPPIPVGVIGAGSTDANSFGLIGTNDVITATLNIILGHQIEIDVCSVHSIQDDEPMRFVSTFVAYGYFGDVVRESERFRWMGPSRYDLTGVNNLIKNRTYKGHVRILASKKSGSPLDDVERCHSNCAICQATSDVYHVSEKENNKPVRPASNNNNNNNHDVALETSADDPKHLNDLILIERKGAFTGVNAAVTACRCPQTKKGFSPGNHLANGCADLILVRPCSRLQYLQYLLRTGWSKKSAFDLKFVEAFRCRQFEFIADKESCGLASSLLGSPESTTSSLYSSSLTTSAPSYQDNGSHANSLDSKDSGRASSKSSPSSVDSLIGDTLSSWNVDGEILNEHSIRVKVNNRLLRVFGTGEPK